MLSKPFLILILVGSILGTNASFQAEGTLALEIIQDRGAGREGYGERGNITGDRDGITGYYNNAPNRENNNIDFENIIDFITVFRDPNPNDLLRISSDSDGVNPLARILDKADEVRTQVNTLLTNGLAENDADRANAGYALMRSLAGATANAIFNSPAGPGLEHDKYEAAIDRIVAIAADRTNGKDQHAATREVLGDAVHTTFLAEFNLMISGMINAYHAPELNGDFAGLRAFYDQQLEQEISIRDKRR